MALNLKRKQLVRFLYNKFRARCYSDNKSVYERNEAGAEPRKVYGEEYPEWRKPWIQRKGEFNSKFALFVEKSPSMSILNTMQNLPNLTLQDAKDWWAQMKVVQEIENQRYLPERVANLGSNLAAVHFFTYRQAAVRLRNAKHWIVGDIEVLEKLPDHYVEGYFVEAIDCSNFHHNGIRFEGLQNLQGLHFLKWLSLKNNKHVDVWCLDRIAGQNGKTLEFLNISGCNLCVAGVFALAKMQALKFLVIADPGENIELQASLSMLEKENPNLLIKIEDPVNEIKS